MTWQVSHPETQMQQTGHSQEAKASWSPVGWSSALWNPDAAGGQDKKEAGTTWAHVWVPQTLESCHDHSHLPFPTTASMLKGERWPYFTSTGTLQNFPVLYICQAQLPLKVVVDKSNWQEKQSKTSFLCLNPELLSGKRIFSKASSKRSGLSQTPLSNPGECSGKGLTLLLDTSANLTEPNPDKACLRDSGNYPRTAFQSSGLCLLTWDTSPSTFWEEG